MNTRKIITITVVLIIVFCAISLTLLILSKVSVVENIIPISYASYPDSKTVVPSDTQKKEYVYAIIEQNDTIKLKTDLNEELLINIDTKNWKEIKWSRNNSYISVLGQTSKDIFNLFIYNILTKTWVQTTIFDKSGITSYEWIDNDTILFTQGGWLHRYKYSSQNEIIKIYQTNAIIVNLSPNETTVLMKNNERFQIISTEGKLLFNLDKINITGNDTKLTIQNAYYNLTSESLILETNEKKLYLWKLGDTTAIEVILNDINMNNLQIICSNQVDFFTVSLLEDKVITFLKLSIVDQELSKINDKEYTLKEVSATKCNNEDTLFQLNRNGKYSWHRIKDTEVETLIPLDNAKEGAIKY